MNWEQAKHEMEKGLVLMGPDDHYYEMALVEIDTPVGVAYVQAIQVDNCVGERVSGIPMFVLAYFDEWEVV